jgi:hypothetical protein
VSELLSERDAGYNSRLCVAELDLFVVVAQLFAQQLSQFVSESLADSGE